MRTVRVRIELPHANSDAEAEALAWRLHEWIETSRHSDTTCPLMSRGVRVRTAYRAERVSKSGLRTLRCWAYVGGKQDAKGNQ